MKSNFIVGAKILGIYLCYLCLLSLFHAISTLIVFQSSASGPYSVMTIVTSTGTSIILIILAGLLLFKTEQLSSVLKIEEDQTIPNQKVSIRAGIMLIGIYVFATNIGRFLATIYFKILEANAGRDPMGTMPNGPAFSKELLTVTATMFFSLFLIFAPNTIEKRINRHFKGEHDK